MKPELATPASLPVDANALNDEALELEIKAAGVRIEAVQAVIDGGRGCYFSLCGERDRLVRLQSELIGKRSPEQVRRMEMERGLVNA